MYIFIANVIINPNEQVKLESLLKQVKNFEFQVDVNPENNDIEELDSGYKSPDYTQDCEELYQNQMSDPRVQTLFDDYYNTVRLAIMLFIG